MTIVQTLAVITFMLVSWLFTNGGPRPPKSKTFNLDDYRVN